MRMHYGATVCLGLVAMALLGAMGTGHMALPSAKAEATSGQAGGTSAPAAPILLAKNTPVKSTVYSSSAGTATAPAVSTASSVAKGSINPQPIDSCDDIYYAYRRATWTVRAKTQGTTGGFTLTLSLGGTSATTAEISYAAAATDVKSALTAIVSATPAFAAIITKVVTTGGPLTDDSIVVDFVAKSTGFSASALPELMANDTSGDGSFIAEATAQLGMLNVVTDTTTGKAPLTVHVENDIVTKSNEVPYITIIQWYVSAPDAAPNAYGEYFTAATVASVTQPYDPSLQAGQQTCNLSNYFTTAGLYHVAARVTVLDTTGNSISCPPEEQPPAQAPWSITAIGDTTGSGVPKATFKATDLLVDSQGLVPLNDWTPLFAFTMTYSESDPAPRTLVELSYTLTTDRFPGERPYNVAGRYPLRNDFLQFAIYRDYGADGPDGVLQLDPSQPYLDELLTTWDSNGYPYEIPKGYDTSGLPIYFTSDYDLTYDLSLTFDPRQEGFTRYFTNPYAPKFPYDKWVTSSVDPYNGYIVAFRTSSSWETNMTLGYYLHSAVGDMYYYSCNDTTDTTTCIVEPSAAEDSYSPDNFGDLGKDVGFSAGFEVIDLTGWDARTAQAGDMNWNRWNYQQFTYTPNAEFLRPRWDIGDLLLNQVGGEYLDLRRLFSVENWYAMLGIHAHGGGSAAQPREVNLVCTDIGGDPFGVPGNGGFNPKDALDRITNTGRISVDYAVNYDYAFNGIWVWHDTNDDGVFEPPVQGTSGGVSFNGDYPMRPQYFIESNDLADTGFIEWQYVPFPPGGGDPWWTIKLKLKYGRRRATLDTTPTGYLDGTPDKFTITDLPKPDYFVVIRPDSGARDSSLVVGDGTGWTLGADTRVFVEPRHWNPCDGGFWDGGILLSNQLVNTNEATRDDQLYLDPYTGILGGFYHWQDDPRVDQICPPGDYPCPNAPSFTPQDTTNPRQFPWWTERTHSRDNTKPIRSGFEIHDLVLTYSSDSRYAKITNIMVGQEYDFSSKVTYTQFPHWMDPFGFLAMRFFIVSIDPYTWASVMHWPGEFLGSRGRLFGYNPYVPEPEVLPDFSLWPGTLADDLTNAQYAFETAPFKLTDEIADNGEVAGEGNLRDPRSYFYPDPAEQPTLPKYTMWPPQKWANIVDGGLRSYCYLADDKGNNEPYHRPISSSSQATYLDDVYVYVLQDPAASHGSNDLAGMWLVDRVGATFKILSNSGNELTLEKGHEAYLDTYYEFQTTPKQVVLGGYSYDLHTCLDDEVLGGSLYNLTFVFISYGGNQCPVFIPMDRTSFFSPLSDGKEILFKLGSSGLEPKDAGVSFTPLTISDYTSNETLVPTDLNDWPYGVVVGQNSAVRRGEWVILKDCLRRNEYPRMSNWPEGWGADKNTAGANGESRAARLLKQHVSYSSEPTAMLGFNLVGADDMLVNSATQGQQITLRGITIAFWGPEFTSDDLAVLDVDGAAVTSGVLLYEDSVVDGVFDAPLYTDLSTIPVMRDAIVPLQPASLSWRSGGPEPIDMNGDYIPDDMSGDGIVTADGITSLATGEALTADEIAQWDGLSDLAWVLHLMPATTWTLPQSDARTGLPNTGAKGLEIAENINLPGIIMEQSGISWPSYWANSPTLFQLDPSAGIGKSLASGGHLGDDLFVAVRTSNTIKQFSQFRCVVPARLPSRTTEADKIAGLQFAPTAYPTVSSFEKVSPDEGVVDWYGHDMLEVSVPTRITDLTPDLVPSTSTTGQALIKAGGPPVAVLGLDCSANRSANVIASGSQGESTDSTFTPTDISLPDDSIYHNATSWTSEVVGLWLVAMSTADDDQDSRVEAYQITGVNGDALTLRAGTPQTGSPWRVVKDPTFLEQVIVEFYDKTGKFNIENDLMPLNQEDPINGDTSGVSVYIDNDWSSENTNGVFDPPVVDSTGKVIRYIDLPIRLDDLPALIGTTGGEPTTQVKLVFSSPGTDNSTGRDTVPYEQQPRLRQPIPMSFGLTDTDVEYGPDFFVVVRGSRSMTAGDTFRAAIVSWGPNTPSEPDPDNFSNLVGTTSGQTVTDFDLYSEFPWGARGIGYITFFKDPQPMYYWTYNKETHLQEVRKEVDHSQDQTDIRYWVRTNPVVHTRTAPIMATAAASIDFEADPLRQVVNGDIQFTLIASEGVADATWSFGDGTKSTELNPVHSYAAVGDYTVSLTVHDQYATEITVTKEAYIEVLAAPYADFAGDPIEGNITPDLINGGVPGLDVTFTDKSVGTDLYTATAWFWNFGDGTTTTEQTTQNPEHRYTAEGVYTVTLGVTFTNSSTGGKVNAVYQRKNYITVNACVAGCTSTEGETVDVNAADFTIDTAIRDKEALVPLTDWVPLVHFNMSYPADTPAPRYLSKLVLQVRPDKREPSALMYGNFAAPDSTDILEFGLFKETDGGDTGDQTLDEDYDYPVYVWDSQGNTSDSVIATLEEYTGLYLVYTLDFIGAGTAVAPEFPVASEADADNGLGGASYFIAVRTSATWRSQITMGCDVLAAQMVIPETGAFPEDTDGAPVDSYSPNFYDGETLKPDNAYSSSFDCWDITGTPTGIEAPGFFDAWNYPGYLYEPVEEFTRPRWNKFNQLLDITAGEILEMANLLPLDTWTPVIGINAQSTKALHFDAYESTGMFRDISSKDAAQLREVNVVLTDMGADPYGAPGNGGFNPKDGLKTNTTDLYGMPVIEDAAFAPDITFNGVWVWHDTNGNGVFDPPTPLAGGGIQFNGDFPLLPGADVDAATATSLGLATTSDWEYVAFPPGGGDPWWRITLKFYGGTRRSLDKIIDKGNVEGFLGKTPNNVVGVYSSSEYTNDYFVVIRTDSGFQDVSLGTGDGAGLTMGADFRAFIEPRRTDANGRNRGGIYMDSMIPSEYLTQPVTYKVGTWQDDTRWGAGEPWWPERTTNAASAKPVRYGVQVHDLVMVYESDSKYRQQTDLFFGDGTFSDYGCFGYATAAGDSTDFSMWVDPFGTQRAKFLNGHAPGVTRWRLFGQYIFPFGGGTGTDSTSLAYDETTSRGQFAYETVPFFISAVDITGSGPRSAAFTRPPDQPTLPEYANWPATVSPGSYPAASDWPSDVSKARLLTQKTDISSTQVPMLGINLIGSADPIVTARNQSTIASITVAFWGPDFSPNDLATLDPSGEDLDSGVMLFEDTDATGTFLISDPFEAYMQYPLTIAGLDQPVPLTGLQWPSKAEFIDLNGDGVADDLNGDGLVDDADKAWVLTVVPQTLWELPQKDAYTLTFNGAFEECGALDLSGAKGAAKSSKRHGLQTSNIPGPLKALDNTVTQPGDDLFITVKTSEAGRRFEQFRAVIPATLPERSEGERKAGIQFYPQVNSSGTAGVKNNPEEDPVQDFYGHDMLEMNVPVRITDMGSQSQLITIGGAAVPTLGLDISTNREADGTLSSGTAGIGAAQSFTVTGAGWKANVFSGQWLVDSGYETFQIVGNTADQLTLLSGQPANGRWRIVTEPTFLEQVVVEFYNEGQDSDFNPSSDLLPLDLDQRVSGVALYRDNDSDPGNRNGLFDPDIDIPIALDAAPVFIGQTGDNIQVQFVFSTPGTDDVPAAMAEQTRHRQWVPDSFSDRTTDEYTGADFFIVVRASGSMTAGTNFRMGIVNWGPNTPTEPDPDTWAVLAGEERNEVSNFEEFSWGSRGLGFITFLNTPKVEYSLHGTVAKQRSDGSAFNWIRSHSTKKRRCGIITARTKPVSASSVVIDSATPSQLPTQTLPSEPVSVVINGSGFGVEPTVVISGYDVEIVTATNTEMTLSIGTRSGTVPTEPIVVIIRNPDTGEEATRSDLFTLTSGSNNIPVITSVSPKKGNKASFPVAVLGKNFEAKGSIEVLFGQTLMPVVAVSAAGTQITVGFPTGGLPGSGPMDVAVRNVSKDTEAVLANGFNYENKAQSTTGCAGDGAGSGNGGPAGDLLVMSLAAAGLALAVRRRRSQV